MVAAGLGCCLHPTDGKLPVHHAVMHVQRCHCTTTD